MLTFAGLILFIIVGVLLIIKNIRNRIKSRSKY